MKQHREHNNKNTRTISAEVESLYRQESRRVLATLIRLLGSFELAEEALQDAFIAAVEQWPQTGVPQSPRAWLISAGRFKAIDSLRRRSRFNASLIQMARELEDQVQTPDLDSVEDDRLRLIFICCHPALTDDAQVALTLREVCDLTTEEIARAFLTKPSTVAQRIVRAKNKILDAHIPYEVPSFAELPERLDAVLRVVYLVFNEGYFASSGDQLTRNDLSSEAIRLGRLLLDLLPEPEVAGLLALMLLNESRRPARTTASGEPVMLEQQDRSLWDRAMIEEGEALVEQALRSGRHGVYSVQAAIAAVHAEATSADLTDWAQIVGLYDVLLRLTDSVVVELNRAVAIAMLRGPQAGLALINALLTRDELRDYHLAWSAKADLCRRAGHLDEARTAYRMAIEKSRQSVDRQFLEGRLHELESQA
ncbi:RNA polymerase subunit sigma-24 [Pseudomonas syringae]|uniref:RNA polymerase subunit sigma-24 n=1 Tax=Pseudomonas syringae TaxID=317 RepID=A0A1C7Z0T6_PSESX|nr:RNA polymerase sigma factor [Pseudomonas syringae]OCR23059.1 RNA polymerase subunit sigma-24 [Pseudomonas syringae]